MTILTIDLEANKRSEREVDAYRWGNVTRLGRMNHAGEETPDGLVVVWTAEKNLLETQQDRLLSGMIGSRIFEDIDEMLVS